MLYFVVHVRACVPVWVCVFMIHINFWKHFLKIESRIRRLQKKRTKEEKNIKRSKGNIMLIERRACGPTKFYVQHWQMKTSRSREAEKSMIEQRNSSIRLSNRLSSIECSFKTADLKTEKNRWQFAWRDFIKQLKSLEFWIVAQINCNNVASGKKRERILSSLSDEVNISYFFSYLFLLLLFLLDSMLFFVFFLSYKIY